ncbi:MAG TPA: hypothetical protein VGH47_04425 [Xanthobacteraceae bacterium]|jgi:prophage DNA circulation protein
MNKADINEAVPIIERLCQHLSSIIVDKADAGVAARTALGQVTAYASTLCWNNTIGASLNNCFDLVRRASCTWSQMDQVRVALTVEKAVTIGGIAVRDYSIQLALAQISRIAVAMTFVSRQDVDVLITALQPSFIAAEETAADTMDSMIYRGMIELHGALINFLVQSARPLPQMLNYRFAEVLPSLVISQRLYGDASRYDEIRNENKIVHPAFCPTDGAALAPLPPS